MRLYACAHSLSRYQQFKDFQKRILVATNLFGRGMDIERVNIVFNYDMPEDSDTYLHRVSLPLHFVTFVTWPGNIRLAGNWYSSLAFSVDINLYF